MNFPELKIDKDKCIHCGMCVKDCIVNCLELNEDNKIPQFVKDKESTCIKCQHCLAVCPVGALGIWGADPSNSEPVGSVNSDELLSLIKSRRSVRCYKSENLDRERMDKLKDMVKYAPTGVNFHKLHFAFVDDIEVMDCIRNKVNAKVVNILSNSIVKKIFPHFRGMADAIKNGNDVIFRGAPHMVIVSVPKNSFCKKEDPLIALSYFDLYAQSMGIGTLWCGFAYYCFKLYPELSKYIEVPDGYRVAYAMLFGVPDMKYSRTTQPEEYNITSVKLQPKNLNMSLVEQIKRLFWNL